MEVGPFEGGDEHGGMLLAEVLFAGRELEAKAFRKVLADFRQYIDSSGQAGDTRRNMLTFYGLGRIGKTTLSNRLENWGLFAVEGVAGGGASKTG